MTLALTPSTADRRHTEYDAWPAFCRPFAPTKAIGDQYELIQARLSIRPTCHIRFGSWESVSLNGSGSGPQKIPTLHHPEGIDPDQIFFYETKIHDLILAYQREPSVETWQAIVMGCLPLIDSLIRSHHFELYDDQDALRGECILKLFKVIQHFNPARGRAFSVLSVAITRFLISYVQAIRSRAKRMILVEDKELEQCQAGGSTRTELPAELKAKIRTIQTRLTTIKTGARSNF